jgi:hypothetical protein
MPNKLIETLAANSILQQNFDNLLLQAIDESLSVLGEPVKNGIYTKVMQCLDITVDEIPDHIEDFSGVIHKILGLGASRLEMLFIKKINQKAGIEIESQQYEWPLCKTVTTDMTFVEYVNTIRRQLIIEKAKGPEIGIEQSSYENMQTEECLIL